MRIHLWVVLGMLVGCGPSAGVIQGSLGGKTVTVRQAIFRSPVQPGGLTVILTADDMACENLKARIENGAGLFFNLQNKDPSPMPGSYAVVDDQKARAGINQNLGPRTAMTWAVSPGKSGTVTLDSLTDSPTGSATGTFELEYQNGDKVTGVFSASACVFQ